VGLLQAPSAGLALAMAGSHIKNREMNGALTLGGHHFIFRHNNQPIVSICNCFNDREEARPGRSAWRPHQRHHFGRRIERQKNDNKIPCGLRWPLFDILHTTTNQRHVGTMEEVKEMKFDRGEGTQGGYNPIFLSAIEFKKM
jgi:hypothetical protein